MLTTAACGGGDPGTSATTVPPLTPRPGRQTPTPATSPGNSATPRPSAAASASEDLTAALDSGVPATIADSIRDWLAENAPATRLRLVETGSTRGADVLVSATDPGAGAKRISPTYWIALANVTSQVDDITSDFIDEAIAGTADWSSATNGTAGPVTLYLATTDVDPLAAVLGVTTEQIAAHAEILDTEKLLDRVLEDASALAILPLQSVDTRGRSLAVDGVDVIREIGEAAAYPFVSSYFATASPDAAQPDLASQLVDYLVRQPSPLEPNIHIVTVGDLIPARCVLARIMAAGPDYQLPFYEIRDKIMSADIAVGTLDMQFVDGVDHNLCFENYEHTGPTAIAGAIGWAGFDLITNATNHSLDGVIRAGPRAYDENHQAFVKAGVEHIGQGLNLKEASKPAIIEVKGVKFGFTAADGVESYTWAGPEERGTSPADPDTVARQVKELLKRVDVVIATCECGIIDGDAEYRRLPTDLQSAMADAALGAGATEYTGGQSHWVQGADFRGSKFVGYHMGNFIYDQDWSYETMHGAILDSYYIGARLVNVRYSIVVIENMCCPKIIEDPAEAQVTLLEIWKATPRLPGSEITP